MKLARDRKNRDSVVIRKEEVVEDGHHGGAWKVAYADFVTAMMAFFLLMWLLNATTEDQRKGLADYFSPTNILSHQSSGTGQPFGGHTAFDDGALVSDRGAVQVIQGNRPIPTEMNETPPQQDPDPHFVARREPDATLVAGQAERPGTAPPHPLAHPATLPEPVSKEPGQSPADREQVLPDQQPADEQQTAQGQQASRDRQAAQRQQAAQEQQAFEAAAEQIRNAVRSDPALSEIARQLAIDLTPEGLRIQILDEDRLPMFATGVAAPNERARALLLKIVPILTSMRHQISIAGHTDAMPYPGPGRTNWELSVERANSTRRLLIDGGLPGERIQRVTGHADKDLLIPSDPLAAANRRIAIVVLREAPPPAP